MGTERNFHHRWKPSTRLGAVVMLGGLSLGTALLGIGYLHAASPSSSSSPVAAAKPAPAILPASHYREVVDTYCIGCHNERLKTASLELDKANVENPPADAAVFEKVVRKLRMRAMPPQGLARPDEATYESMVAYLETTLDRAAAAKLNPGRPAVHRLNRTEYSMPYAI
jgi:mono/diheme cytochrome c family protein